jgi:hypothetical protein
MRNHTATHLLNAALHKIISVTSQKSSHVTESSLRFDFSTYGETFNAQNIVSLFHFQGYVIRPYMFGQIYIFKKRYSKIIGYVCYFEKCVGEPWMFRQCLFICWGDTAKSLWTAAEQVLVCRCVGKAIDRVLLWHAHSVRIQRTWKAPESVQFAEFISTAQYTGMLQFEASRHCAIIWVHFQAHTNKLINFIVSKMPTSMSVLMFAFLCL